MRTVVITGAGSGIGRASAARFVSAGDRVLALGRRTPPLQTLRRDLGDAVEIRSVDVGDPGAVHAALSGRSVDVLVANAGLCATADLDAADALDVWRAVLRTNLDGAFHCLRAVHGGLVEGGRVVLVSSGLGKLGRPGYAAYCAAKHGVLGLTRSAALELAPRRITVNAVCPGWVDTAMSRADLKRAATAAGTDPADLRRDAEAAIPLGRFVAPEEAAGLIDWLASPAAAMITGQAYNIGGGEFSA